MKTTFRVLSCFVPGNQLMSAVINAFSQIHSVVERRKWAGWIVVLVPCSYSALVMYLILLVSSYLWLVDFP